MLDNKLQEALDKINSISINSISPTYTTDISYNGITAGDISSLSSTSIPTLTTAQLSAIGQPTYTIASPSTTGANLVWQTPNAWTTTSAVGATMSVGKSGQLDLKGEDADITINGKSMMRLLERIEDRLNLLEPNTELEKDWDDLRRLGERYRKLEKKCKEKAETWKKLKAMPPPSVD